MGLGDRGKSETVSSVVIVRVCYLSTPHGETCLDISSRLGGFKEDCIYTAGVMQNYICLKHLCLIQMFQTELTLKGNFALNEQLVN